MEENAMGRSGDVVVAALSMLLALCVGCARFTAPHPESPVRVDTTGLQEAVAVATSTLHGQLHGSADDYTLTSAQQLLVKNRYVWLITFKPTRLLPKDPSKEPGGAGGEVFVNVDPVTKKAEIRGGE
jgi:hypothetical protein